MPPPLSATASSCVSADKDEESAEVSVEGAAAAVKQEEAQYSDSSMTMKHRDSRPPSPIAKNSD